ncbi:MAG: ribonuclease HII [Candidatus Moranbacteria bacterium]|nr:ribonuclease HII [Candidatus Moranbacteria bacterium]
MILASFDCEVDLFSHGGYRYVIGLDEAGRGPLAGPVVAASVCVRYDFSHDVDNPLWRLVRDSKSLSEKQRDRAFDFVSEMFFVGVGQCDHETVDRVNILQASFLAMKKSLVSLEQVMHREGVGDFRHDHEGVILLVDGAMELSNLSGAQRAVPQGDKYVRSIAAASIIAKVTRDRFIVQIAEKYPEYGFERHKGYGTALHMEMLEKYGPCPIHRKSFGPVKKLLL